MILVDTNVLIDHIRGNEQARSALIAARTAGEQVSASVLTKVELIAGARGGETGVLETLFDEIEWVPVDDAVAERAGELAARYGRTHRGIEVVDYVVAATAEALDADLWTLNRKHFPMLPDLAAPY